MDLAQQELAMILLGGVAAGDPDPGLVSPDKHFCLHLTNGLQNSDIVPLSVKSCLRRLSLRLAGLSILALPFEQLCCQADSHSYVSGCALPPLKCQHSVLVLHNPES